MCVPEHTDEVIRADTGRSWGERRGLIDAWPAHTDGHAAVSALGTMLRVAAGRAELSPGPATWLAALDDA